MQGHIKDLQVLWKAGLQLHWMRLFRMKVVGLFHLFFLEDNVLRVVVV